MCRYKKIDLENWCRKEHYLYYTNNSWLIAAASCMKEETMELKDGTITLTLPPMGAALITMYL